MPGQQTDHDNPLQSLQESILGSIGRAKDSSYLNALTSALHAKLKVDLVFVLGFTSDQLSPIRLITASGDQAFANLNADQLDWSSAQGTLMARLLKGQDVSLAENALSEFPMDHCLKKFAFSSVLAIPLKDNEEKVIGVLAALNKAPLKQPDRLFFVIRLFAQSASAELAREFLVDSIRDEIEINQTQLDAAPALMFMISESGKFLRWNHYFYSKFGYSHQQMKKMTVTETIAEQDRRRVSEEIGKVMADGRGQVSFYGLSASGEKIPVFASAQRVAYGNQSAIVGVALDMTTQMELEEHLIRSQGRLARKNSQLTMINRLVEKLHLAQNEQEIGDEVSSLLREISPESAFALVLTDSVGENMEIITSRGLSEYMRQFRSVFPIGEADTLTGIATRERQLIVVKDLKNDPRLSPELRQSFKTDGLQSGLAVPLIFDNEILGVMIVVYLYKSQMPKDEIEFMQTVANSLSLALANSRQFALMQSLATTDVLTNLPNRNAFMRATRAMLKSASINDYCTGLVLVDLDRFKEINDTLDHQIGDKLLKQVGPRLDEATSQIEADIYRIGGDEFGVLVKDKQRGRQTRVIAEVIQIALQQSFLVEGLNLEINSSIGVMLAEADSSSASELLRCAELAMYQAKSGGGGVAHYREQLDEDRHQRFVIMAEMAEAIRDNQLVLHYQPKYDCKSKKIVGCEALVRWQHRHYNLIPPGKFIPVVELTQLINPLTEWVVNEALQQLEQWQRQGFQLTMSVNLASRNLADGEFIAQIRQLITQSGISPHQLEFELTESQLVEDLEWAGRHLMDLSRLGFNIALDDYGTGYSSLTYLKHLPISTLKIDQTFISEMLLDPTAMTIANSTIELAHNLGMTVVAEGVEDEKTLHWLSANQCDLIQGFFIGRPLPADEFSALVKQFNASAEDA